MSSIFYEAEFEFVRSRGPGGQNVNKTNSAAILRWNLIATQLFTDFIKEKLITKLSSKLNEAGELLIRSEIHRDQDANKKECIQKLARILDDALFEHKKRVATKPSRRQKAKRLESKKVHSDKKSMRKKVDN